MRDAESLLGQVIAVGGKEVTREEADLVIPRSDISEVINLLEALTKKDAANGIRLVNRVLDEGINIKQFNSDIIEILRKIMLAKLNPALLEKLSLELGETLEKKINKISQELDLEQVILFIQFFIEARNELKASFIVQLPLELAIARICFEPNRGTKMIVNRPRNSLNNRSSDVSDNNRRPALTKSIKIAEGQSGDIDINTIIDKWHEVLAMIKQHNHSLSFILRVCEPKELNGNKLCMAFKYKFHKDRVGDIQIKNLIEKVLNEVYGSPLVIEAVIDESIKVKSQNNHNKEIDKK